MRHGVHIAGADAAQLVNQRKRFAEVSLVHLDPNVEAMFSELSWWAQTLKTARAS
jgi:hypothetical protein